ncbi:flagellar protein FlaG [Methylobacterium sp. R2-1]|uniref:flagellar protein FlaG n=1 Tax=Methylobacterium sp. R2-1 TaxID=2587064 RepID=UPI00160844D8|nr:flagellar protein FlaG [Methylobacterium sp. R2-1]MBB2960366.1 putative FlaG/YvyC family protein [Methylobacterium sp. R2-1]
MDPIRAAASTPPVSTTPVTPVRPVADTDRNEASTSRVLDPAVTVAVSPENTEAKPSEPERRAYIRDAESKSLVFRVTDPQTGDVVMQIPDEVILKARAYARETTPFPGERLAKTA